MDVREVNRQVIEQFRAGGEIEGMHRERLVLLTTVGVRTGQLRTTPMMFHPDGDRLLVVASNVGAPRHPDWYHNLVANPRVTVEVGNETYEAVATPLEGEERDRLWAMLKQTYPFFADHEMLNLARDPGRGAHSCLRAAAAEPACVQTLFLRRRPAISAGTGTRRGPRRSGCHDYQGKGARSCSTQAGRRAAPLTLRSGSTRTRGWRSSRWPQRAPPKECGEAS